MTVSRGIITRWDLLSPKKFLQEFKRKLRVLPNGCWLWTGWVQGSGYGGLKVNGKNEQAHRMAYRLIKGPIKKGLCVLHRCDIPLCCNPKHLWLGTHQDNSDDKIAKDRQGWSNRPKTHCVNGHAFTQENIRRKPNGCKSCRICGNEKSRLNMARSRRENPEKHREANRRCLAKKRLAQNKR